MSNVHELLKQKQGIIAKLLHSLQCKNYIRMILQVHNDSLRSFYIRVLLIIYFFK